MNSGGTPLHDPRPYLFGGDDVSSSAIGILEGGFNLAGEEFEESNLIKQLAREQATDYRQARREGFHPVLVVDLETGVSALEMRKQRHF